MQIRGGDPNFTRVLVDGVPVNDGTYQVGEVFDVEALPADGAARVEVVRGPLSSHYGSTGLAGAVQVITRLGDGPPSGTSRRPPATPTCAAAPPRWPAAATARAGR